MGNALGALTLVVDKLAELRETFFGVGVEVVAGDALLTGEGGQIVYLAEGNGGVINALTVIDNVLIGTGEAVSVDIGSDAVTGEDVALEVVAVAGEVVAGLAVGALEGACVPVSAVGDYQHAYALVYSVAYYASAAETW